MTDNENKPDQEIIDAAEFDTDVSSDLYSSKHLDEDEEGDDGIFAPEIIRKKKSGSKTTAVAVVLVALLGGGAFYYFNQSKLEELVPPAAQVETPDISAEAPPATDSPVVAPPETVASTETLPPSTLDTIDTPTPPVEEGAAEVSATAPEEQAAPEETAAKAETQATETSTPDIDSMPENTAPLPPEADLVPPDTTSSSSAKISEVGENPQLAPPPITNAGPAVEADLGNSELAKAGQTINAAPKKEVQINYYDAPKGKALLDIPPPSINPLTEPGQSIIIVHKNKAEPAYDTVIEKGDDSHLVEARITSANRAARIGKDDAAIDFYNQAYKKNPNDPRILMGRAVSYQKLGENEKAIQDYKDVLRIEPNNPEALTNLMGLVGKNKPAVALENLLTLRDKYPRNASVAAQLGVAYAQSGNQEEGLKYLNIAAELQPENPLHFYNMAVISDRLGNREKAIQYYEQSLDVYSVNGSGSDAEFSREKIYDRLSQLRGSN